MLAADEAAVKLDQLQLTLHVPGAEQPTQASALSPGQAQEASSESSPHEGETSSQPIEYASSTQPPESQPTAQPSVTQPFPDTQPPQAEPDLQAQAIKHESQLSSQGPEAAELQPETQQPVSQPLDTESSPAPAVDSLRRTVDYASISHLPQYKLKQLTDWLSSRPRFTHQTDTAPVGEAAESNPAVTEEEEQAADLSTKGEEQQAVLAESDNSDSLQEHDWTMTRVIPSPPNLWSGVKIDVDGMNRRAKAASDFFGRSSDQADAAFEASRFSTAASLAQQALTTAAWTAAPALALLLTWLFWRWLCSASGRSLPAISHPLPEAEEQSAAAVESPQAGSEAAEAEEEGASAEVTQEAPRPVSVTRSLRSAAIAATAGVQAVTRSVSQAVSGSRRSSESRAGQEADSAPGPSEVSGGRRSRRLNREMKALGKLNPDGSVCK